MHGCLRHIFTTSKQAISFVLESNWSNGELCVVLVFLGAMLEIFVLNLERREPEPRRIDTEARLSLQNWTRVKGARQVLCCFWAFCCSEVMDLPPHFVSTEKSRTARAGHTCSTLSNRLAGSHAR